MAPPPAAIEVEVKGVTDISSVVIPDPLTVNDVPHRRAKAPKMSGGVAAHASSDMFKSPVCYIDLDTGRVLTIQTLTTGAVVVQ